MKYLSSFAAAHAAVIALVIGVFLIDGCAHRQARTGPNAPNLRDARDARDVPDVPALAFPNPQGRATTAKGARP
ncbi:MULTISPECIES: hypothetical protein [unclassified Variovorax]|uniref:hypothetical protein n=1 Tax=unclassified Variovorax TaxID=663243 RepID=UPI0008BFBD64|nr:MULTISPECIES: hypothetical protein [unclassified Variovorax]SEK15896.1 hypothetical protein SAMN05518853_11999 [Variovorax sp. OK202]SFE23202.1 hypothetical protein SAMN05444746_11999 [Variovorax sp. OK212]